MIAIENCDLGERSRSTAKQLNEREKWVSFMIDINNHHQATKLKSVQLVKKATTSAGSNFKTRRRTNFARRSHKTRKMFATDKKDFFPLFCVTSKKILRKPRAYFEGAKLRSRARTQR